MGLRAGLSILAAILIAVCSDRGSDRMETSVLVVDSSERHLTLECIFPEPSFWEVESEDGVVRSIRIPGCISPPESDGTSMPVKSALIAVPPESKIDLDVDVPEPVGLPGIGHLSVHGSNIGRPVSVDEAGVLREFQTARVSFRPITMNSKSGVLTAAKRIRAKLTFRGGERTRRRMRASDPFVSIYKCLIVNYSQAQSWRLAQRESNRAPTVPNGIRWRISVRESGWYRITHDDLAKTGVALDRIDPRRLAMSCRGVPVAIVVSGESDGRFDEEDFIEFYGYLSGENRIVENVYWLSTSDGQPLRMKTTEEKVAPEIAEETYEHTALFEENNLHWATFPNSEMKDRFFWARLIAPCDREFGISLDQLSGDDNTAMLRVTMQGNSKLTHHVIVRMNDRTLGDSRWDGQTETIFSARMPGTWLREGMNTVGIELPGNSDQVDAIYLNRIEVAYRRRLIPSAGDFWFTRRATDGNTFKISGITGENLRLFDVTCPTTPIIMNGVVIEENSDRFDLVCTDSSPGEHLYLLITDDRVREPESISPKGLSMLRSPENRADYLIISHPDFVPELSPIREKYSAEDLAVKVVDASEIYDEFGHGFKSDEAIREFISSAFHNWAEPAPHAVLLVGDATYDPCDLLGVGDHDYLPTHLVNLPYLGDSASDDWFVCVAGEDDLPDLLIGRIPARSSEEVRNYVRKLTAYPLETEGDDWWRRILLVTDDEEAFDSGARLVSELVPDDYSVNHVSVRENEPRDIADRIIKAMSGDAAIIDYLGHGGWNVWAQERIFETKDIDRLTETSRLPFVINMTCLSGCFHHPERTDILDENLIFAQNKGAIAVLAPAGASSPWWQSLFNEQLMDNLCGRGISRIGSAMLAAKIEFLGGEFRNDDVGMYNILGDPLVSLPSPKRYEKWDVNRSGFVDIEDLMEVAIRFGTKPSPLSFPDPDVNADGEVDILDLVLVSTHFGEKVGDDRRTPKMRDGSFVARLEQDGRDGSKFRVMAKGSVECSALAMVIDTDNSNLIDIASGDAIADRLHQTFRFSPIPGSVGLVFILSDHTVLGDEIIGELKFNTDTVQPHLQELVAASPSNKRFAKIGETEYAVPDFSDQLRFTDAISVPNPSPGRCTISYALTRDASVTLKIYTVTGRLIKTLVGCFGSLRGELFWDGHDENGKPVANGIYLARLIATDEFDCHAFETLKLAVIR